MTGCAVFVMFSVSLVVLENRFKTKLYRKLHQSLLLDTCKTLSFDLLFYKLGFSLLSWLLITAADWGFCLAMMRLNPGYSDRKVEY